MTPPLADLMALANAAADAVAPTLAAPDRAELGIDTKSSATDMVTVVDTWSEETIVALLLDARPDDGLLGEEGANKPSSTGVTWVIDPIDGTTNFIRDLPGFSVSIAARIDGVDSVGVVHDVVRGERFEATLGGGAFCNGERLEVSAPVPASTTNPTSAPNKLRCSRACFPTSPTSVGSGAPPSTAVRSPPVVSMPTTSAA